jgi:hypothetical protein
MLCAAATAADAAAAAVPPPSFRVPSLVRLILDLQAQCVGCLIFWQEEVRHGLGVALIFGEKRPILCVTEKTPKKPIPILLEWGSLNWFG